MIKPLFLLFLLTLCCNLHSSKAQDASLHVKKQTIKESMKECLKLCENVLVEIMHKEIAHIVKHLPEWIERLLKIKYRSLPENFDENKFISLVLLLEKNKPKQLSHCITPLFNELSTFSNESQKHDYIIFLMNSEKNSLDLLDEMLHLLQASLENNAAPNLLKSSSQPFLFKMLYT